MGIYNLLVRILPSYLVKFDLRFNILDNLIVLKTRYHVYWCIGKNQRVRRSVFSEINYEIF